MTPLITRAMFWFKENGHTIRALGFRFFPLGNLLTRLLNEKYSGKKIKFINLDFMSESTYQLYPDYPRNYLHFYMGHLKYYDVFDFEAFYKMSEKEQDYFVWQRGCEILQEAGKSIKNSSLAEASEYAWKKGIETGLNPDYNILQADVVLHHVPLKAVLGMHFSTDRMYSSFRLEKDDQVIFEKPIDSARFDSEFFYVMYKKILAVDNSIIIKGHYDVDYLPLKIAVTPEMLASH